MSTVEEIKTAIARLNERDRALLTAELFASNAEPDEAASVVNILHFWHGTRRPPEFSAWIPVGVARGFF
ncbi:MAG: hypothetical protein DLM73_05785 [Chthoniobacterales bacterium]|nr:MAG: hypothetical protein DLM73_05785 [Chthoniobacterales bacterium]